MNKKPIFISLLLLGLLTSIQTHKPTCVHHQKKIPVIPHPGLESDEGRVLLSNNWQSMRIAASYYLDNATPTVRKVIQEQLMPAVIAYYQAALKVRRLSQRVAMPDYVTQYCAEVNSNSYLRNGVAADLILLVKGLDEPDQQYIAYAGACTIETTYGRPITGIVNFNYHYGFDSTSDLNYQSQIYTTLHEIGHVLGFSSDLYPTFVDPNTGSKLSSPTMTKTVNGDSITILTLAPLTTKLRTYFACPTLEGAYIEQEGGDGSAGSHFERRVFMNEFMTASDIVDARITEFFLALLEGTGWYSPDYSLAEPLLWGKGQGCNFLETKCINPTTKQTAFPNYFCSTLDQDSCSFGDQAYGVCGTTDASTKNPALKSAFNYWGDNTAVLDTFSDNCPYSLAYTSTECKDDTNEPIHLPNGESFGYNSSCFTGTLVNSGSPASTTSYCFQRTCKLVSPGQYNVLVQVGDQTITCTTQQSVTVTGFSGTLNCPNPNTFCTTSALAYCPRGCMGRGSCVDGECVCRANYYGRDCSYQIPVVETEKKSNKTVIIIAVVAGVAGVVVVTVAVVYYMKLKAKRLNSRRVSGMNHNNPSYPNNSHQASQIQMQMSYSNYGQNGYSARGQPAYYGNGQGMQGY